MATRTIDILLNLQNKKTTANADLLKTFTELEKKASNLQKAIDRVGDGKNAEKLKARLAGVKSEMQQIDAEAKKRTLENNLKRAGEQANRTREKMEKLAQVGNRLALVGGAITAPFILAMKKYVETAKDTEGTSKRIIELQNKWAESQVKIGRVTAEILLPTLEKALDVVNKIADFAEKNPGAIKAALGIGGSLVVIGGFLSTAASIVSTLATIQGLAAGLGIGGAAAGGAGLSAALAPVIAALAPVAVIAGQVALIVGAVVIAAEATRQLLNWALGTETTWNDILVTASQVGFLIEYGFKQLGGWIKNGISVIVRGIAFQIANVFNAFRSVFSSVSAALANIANAIRSFLRLPKKAEGGMTNGLSIAGEAGREFIMSNQTTRQAENMLGGRLTQERLLNALSGGRRVNYYDNRRVSGELSPSQMHALKNGVLEAMAGAL